MSYAKSLEQPRRRVLLVASVLAFVMVLLLAVGGPSGAVAQAGRGSHDRVGSRGLGRWVVLGQRHRTPTEKGLHGGRPAQPAPWTIH